MIGDPVSGSPGRPCERFTCNLSASFSGLTCLVECWVFRQKRCEGQNDKGREDPALIVQLSANRNCARCFLLNLGSRVAEQHPGATNVGVAGGCFCLRRHLADGQS